MRQSLFAGLAFLAAGCGSNRKMDRSSMPGTLRSRAGGNLEAQQKVRNKALAKTVQAGSPMPVMRECVHRFG